MDNQQAPDQQQAEPIRKKVWVAPVVELISTYNVESGSVAQYPEGTLLFYPGSNPSIKYGGVGGHHS